MEVRKTRRPIYVRGEGTTCVEINVPYIRDLLGPVSKFLEDDVLSYETPFLVWCKEVNGPIIYSVVVVVGCHKRLR